jgi:hypothetical protein
MNNYTINVLKDKSPFYKTFQNLFSIQIYKFNELILEISLHFYNNISNKNDLIKLKNNLYNNTNIVILLDDLNGEMTITKINNTIKFELFKSGSIVSIMKTTLIINNEIENMLNFIINNMIEKIEN